MKESIQHGEQKYKTELTDEEVLKIRHFLSQDFSRTLIANQFGISLYFLKQIEDNKKYILAPFQNTDEE